MDLSKALEGIEKLFLEILGYLLPGLALVFLASSLIDKAAGTFSVDLSQIGSWELIAAGYVLGYIVYGLALVKDEFVKSIVLKFVNWVRKKMRKGEIKSKRSLIEDNIEGSPEVEIVRSALKELLKAVKKSTNDMNLHQLRNLAMSYVPQSDRKVYTFMFRADLCDHIGTLALVVGLWGFLGHYTNRFFSQGLLLSTQEFSIYWYAGLVLASYFLAKTHTRFLSIALSIPFSMFIAQYYSIEDAKK